MKGKEKWGHNHKPQCLQLSLGTHTVSWAAREVTVTTTAVRANAMELTLSTGDPSRKGERP